MPRFNTNRIADPVHGTIGLSDLEIEIINTRSFQRLRNVNQLGLAHFVYPSANYSRLSHSIGTCHVAGLILDSLKKNGAEIDDDEIQLYRLAALLHDIGHYPFSHPMEKAVTEYHSEAIIKLKTSKNEIKLSTKNNEDDHEVKSLKHEDVAKVILKEDETVNSILVSHGIDIDVTGRIITRSGDIPYKNLVSSDMDADRMDYMLRTSYHTGLPYGSVDIGYIISQMRLDDKRQLAVSSKALKTVDHFLLCHYFDYQQVYYHKTVTGFELILKDVLKILLKSGLINCSAQSIIEKIKNDAWHDFDDAEILQKIRELSTSLKSGDINKLKTESILSRKPPKLVLEMEYIQPRNHKPHFLSTIKGFRRKIDEWSQRYKIEKGLWYDWDSATVLTKVRSHVPVSALIEEKSDDIEQLGQTVQIFDKDEKITKPIVDIEHSLTNILSNYALYTFRIYVLFGDLPESDRNKIKKEISVEIKKDFAGLPIK